MKWAQKVQIFMANLCVLSASIILLFIMYRFYYYLFIYLL